MRLKLSLMPVCLAAALLSASGCASNNANSNAASASSSGANTAPPGAQSSAPVQSAAGQANATATNSADGHGAGGASAGSPGASKNVDACALLTPDEIKSVQGEAVKETKPSRRDDQSLRISQCFFTTATFNKSVSLEVTTSADGQSARRFWDEHFERARAEAGKGEKEREREKKEREKRERDADKKAGARGEQEEEEGSLPSPVKGLGDEAYWAASRVNGTLYARKGDSFVRLSVGGSDPDAARLRKARTLAQKALARL